MPLTRGREDILITMNGVRFLMQDGRVEIPCRASLDLLADRFGSSGEPTENERAFRLNRLAIEEAASRKYDAGDLDPRLDPKVTVTAADMASSLSRKM